MNALFHPKISLSRNLENIKDSQITVSLNRECLNISDYNYKELQNNYISKNKGYDQNIPLWKTVNNDTLKGDFRNSFQVAASKQGKP